MAPGPSLGELQLDTAEDDQQEAWISKIHALPPQAASPTSTYRKILKTSLEIKHASAGPTHVPMTGKPMPNRRKAIVSSVWNSAYASYALMLGWSLTQHNNLKAMGVDMVLLTLDDGTGNNGLTAENKTRLERVGWKIRIAEKMAIPGVDENAILAHRRLNLNKLQPFGWDEYEKIVTMDADTVCKGKIADLFAMPGEFAAAHDVWWNVTTDARFNSGVMSFTPSAARFRDMIMNVPKLHDPRQGDQDFLQKYWQDRDFKFPMKYNLNVVMYEYHHERFQSLWEDAAIVHFTVHKPNPNRNSWCRVEEAGVFRVGRDCRWFAMTDWYRRYFEAMLKNLGYENEIAVLAG